MIVVDCCVLYLQVSIVSHIISLASCTSDPAVPYFSRDTTVHAVRTVVDGFLEMCIFVSLLFC